MYVLMYMNVFTSELCVFGVYDSCVLHVINVYASFVYDKFMCFVCCEECTSVCVSVYVCVCVCVHDTLILMSEFVLYSCMLCVHLCVCCVPIFDLLFSVSVRCECLIMVLYMCTFCVYVNVFSACIHFMYMYLCVFCMFLHYVCVCVCKCVYV